MKINLKWCSYTSFRRLKFLYALTGQIQSDALESRFGRYRQMSGGNFFISVKQVFESESKIKLVSLLKHSGISLLSIVKCESVDVGTVCSA